MVAEIIRKITKKGEEEVLSKIANYIMGQIKTKSIGGAVVIEQFWMTPSAIDKIKEKFPEIKKLSVKTIAGAINKLIAKNKIERDGKGNLVIIEKVK